MTIPEADAALRSLIESALDGHDVSLSFDPPTSAWSRELGDDALIVNCYLYELAENTTLREARMDRTPMEDRRIGESEPPPLADLQYVISVWAGPSTPGPTAEHELLSELARCVFPSRSLSDSHLPADTWVPADFSVPMRVLAPLKAGLGGFWQSMGQPWRPTLLLVMTIPLEISAERVYAPVTSAHIGFEGRDERLMHVAGIVASGGGEARPIEGATVSLVGAESLELDRSKTDTEGRFTLSARQDGNLVLEARAHGYRTTKQRIGRFAERSRDEVVIEMRKAGG